tara:strand:- start:508 stop:1173 length:666 start_codon:yes stop_codon:yes gene_type:complete
MNQTQKTKISSRIGRPRLEESGEVNARILAAATELFLSKGVAATSCEAVVARAQVGKASLYSRYSGKDALFEAVIKHAVESGSFQMDATNLPEGTVRERLAFAGKAVLMQALSPVPLELLRLFLTEARRFPDLIAHVDSMARSKVVDIVARSMTASPQDAASRKAVAIAERFLDLTFAPIILAALTGRATSTSSDAIERQIAFALDILERSGPLEDALSPQ